MNNQNKKLLFVVFLPQEWEIYHRRPYWEAMAVHSEILIVEPPSGILTAWRQPKRFKDLFRGLRPASNFAHKIYYYRPYQLVTPGFNFIFSFFNKIDRMLMRHQLKKIIKRINKHNAVVVTFLVHVYQQHFSKILKNAKQCFEITDLYLLAHWQENLDDNHWYTKKAKRFQTKMVKESELVITSSKLIFEQLREIRHDIYYMTNAADYTHFSKSVETSLTIPEDLNQWPRPRLGFIGYINQLIDFELLAKLAQGFPESAIIMVGGVQAISMVTDDPLYKATLEIPNIHYLGFKKYETLPAYLRGFDVCLMPFKLNDWMKHSAPNKTYQYLASGKPIVSTDFTEVKQYEDAVYVAKSHGEFIKMVKQGLDERDELKAKYRRRLALENSTEHRARKLFEIVSKKAP